MEKTVLAMGYHRPHHSSAELDGADDDGRSTGEYGRMACLSCARCKVRKVSRQRSQTSHPTRSLASKVVLATAELDDTGYTQRSVDGAGVSK